MNYTEINDDLKFLSNYWKIAKTIGDKIKKELPIIEENNKVLNIGNKLKIINYKDLTNWDISQIVKSNISINLKALGNKINTMIINGRANDIEPMLNRIINRNPSTQVKPVSKKLKKLNNFEGWSYNNDPEILGIGHFRWNFKAYILTAEEIEIIKKYFKL